MRRRRRNPWALRGDVVVVSPHLDDAVFSVGAGIANAARAGASVCILTVFAGDPHSGAPAGWWDHGAGFVTAGEAARVRRDEDRRACAILGATPAWLPFSDASYGETVDDQAVSLAVRSATAAADLVLVPGFPLAHVDHLRIARLLLEAPVPPARLVLYVEQPYAKWHVRRRPWRQPSIPAAIRSLTTAAPEWTVLPAESRDRRAKYQASIAYQSQLKLFGRVSTPALGKLLQRRVALYEALRGGETVAYFDNEAQRNSANESRCG